VAALRRRGITSSWDFGWNDVLAQDPGLTALIDALDVVFVNASEAALYAGEPRLEAALPFWRARRPLVVIKRGAQGCLALGSHGKLEAPAPTVKVVDTTGAGDAFVAGLLSIVSRAGPLEALPRAELERAVRFASRVAARVVTRVGAVAGLPRAHEISV
jgi:sugar/nucleoside kinase (ribokinase family)